MTPTAERVLVVDDEPQVLVALSDLLSDEFAILTADSGEQALTLAEEEPDLAVIVTDQRLPGLSGDELLALLEDRSAATRILVTGYADLTAVIRAVNVGRLFAYVSKPWSAEDLRLKVRRAAERYRLTNELARERQLLHDLMDNVPDGICLKDRELRVLGTNRAFSMLLGVSAPDTLVGRRLSEVLGESPDAGHSEAEERRILSMGSAVQDLVTERQLAHGKRWLSETKAPIRNASGEVIGLVGITRDVTERVETQEALSRVEEQLRQSQKMEAIGRTCRRRGARFQ